MAKTVLITGTSSGIGRSTAEYFSEKGWNVVATMRKPSCDAADALSALPNVHVVTLDVTKPDTIASAMKSAVEKFGGIDALVNNAGYGLVGAMECATSEQLELQFQTNLLGPIRCMQAVLPTMRAAKSGVIVNVSSVGGRIVIPLNTLYHATKFGLEGVSESAALELAPLGIRVRIVEPGSVKTDFGTKNLVIATSDTVRDYDPMFMNALEAFNGLMEHASEPHAVAKVIYEAVTDEGDKIRYTAGEGSDMIIKNRLEISDEDHQKRMSAMFKLS